ncbi:uncharacterized protein [Haliotis asinina]|uniref:uncharacterized protein n=1 Tax=Haliotis asinina TaxID=109174 RepID=UPI003531D4DD
MTLLPPAGLPEVVFSVDTTASMRGCLAEVRSRLQDMIQRLQADIPAIRIAIFVHGDYCTKSIYVTKWIDFTTDVKELCDFIMNVEYPGGKADGGECYEFVLRQVGEKLSWTPGSNRVLVVVGDDDPHGPDFRDNAQKIDWREETHKLKQMEVKIYGIQCNNRAMEFYQIISTETEGRHLILGNYTNIIDFLMAICYREYGPDILHVYEKEVRARRGDGALSDNMEGMFTSLRDVKVSPPPRKRTITIGAAKIKDLKSPTLKKTTTNKKVLKAKPKSVRTKSVKKPTKVVAPLLRREEVSENTFSLRNMDWSHWIKVISPDLPLKLGVQWEKRRGANPGFRKKTVFKVSNNKPALYEVGVQKTPYGRKFVVFSKFCRHIPDNVKWETRLFGNKNVKAQVNNVVSQNCSVYVRRVVYRRRSSHLKTLALLKSYDYAWRHSRSRSCARHVSKQTCTISSDKM